jgi:hypothetical protein
MSQTVTLQNAKSNMTKSRAFDYAYGSLTLFKTTVHLIYKIKIITNRCFIIQLFKDKNYILSTQVNHNHDALKAKAGSSNLVCIYDRPNNKSQLA